jgi:hypothetical protein
VGANDCFFIIKGGNEKHVRREVNKKIKSDMHEYGHGGYTGTFAECRGLDFADVEPFLSFKAAHEFLFGKFSKDGKYTAGLLKKWEPAIAVEFRNDEGQLNWLVGGIFSC